MVRRRTSPLKKSRLRNQKWIDLSKADGSVSTAAHLTLENRISAVETYLPLAAFRHAETIEYVHQLRVSTRRALAALVLYEPFLSPERSAWMQKRMKRIRKAAGEARDLDVLIERFEHSESPEQMRLIPRLKKLRRVAQKSIVKLNRRLIDDNRLARRKRKLLRSIPVNQESELERFAKRQLDRQADLFFGASPETLRDVEALHQFRIRAKAFRYTIELLSDALPETARARIYPVVCRAQEILGELNDHAIASDRFKRWSKQETAPRLRKSLKQLARIEKEQIEEAKHRFGAWWTTQFASEFESLVRTTIADDPPFGAAG